MAIEAINRTLPDWLSRIASGETKLPRFQRYEAWGHGNVATLFNTVLQELPAGSLLVLQIGNQEPFISRPIAGAPDEGERVTEHLLDGQQRITALWRGLKNNYEDRTYFLFFDEEEDSKAPYFVDSISRGRRNNDERRYPLWADNPVEQWKRRMVPLDLFAPGDNVVQDYRAWARQAIPDSDEREDVNTTVFQIRQKLATFNLPFLSLPVGTDRDVALDVFIKTNTSSAPLDDYDIVVAQVEAGAGKSLHDLVAETKVACPDIARYYAPENLALASAALLQKRVPGKSTYLSPEFGNELIRNWDQYRKGVVRTSEFLVQEKIFDADRLPTDVVLPVLVAIWATAPDGPDAEGRARTILRRYMWRAFFTKRYERTTATRSLVDFNELSLYVSDPEATVPSILSEDANPLPEMNELKEAGWPKKKDRLARAILAVSLRNGGLDLADGSAVSIANLPKREYHHLFPEAHLKNTNTPDHKIFRSLNCALISWRTNRTISSKEPETYLAERRQDDDPSDKEIKQRLISHLIPYDEMIAGNYEEFLEKRAEMIETAMKSVCA